ncbi:uncharacterized protein LOC108032933 isoform X2 [Drosophila biarmipes]|nr:uncharacterized protein LOC108032933 isoform X2 [Drosophila biarmipes]
MLFEKDNIVFDEEENEMNTLDIYENERQGKVYPYPFFLADDDTWYRNDDVFSVACPEAIPITQKPEAAHTRIGTTHATHATPADDLPNPISAELIICDSSSSDGADVVAIQNPVTSTLKRSASSSVAHKHSQKIILQKRHSTRDTPEYIRQFLPFEMFKQAFKRSDTSQLEIEEDKSVTSAVSGSVSCVTTKKTLNAEVPDPSFGEIEILTIDQVDNNDTSTSTSNTSTTETEKADLIDNVRSAEDETTNESTISYCEESNSPTASSGYPVVSTTQFIPSPAGENKAPRKRGRPAKDHADGPDPQRMLRMNSKERKAYEERVKNNESSRMSRRKKKKREEEEMKAEEDLVAENLRLRELVDKLSSQERKLKKFLIEQKK